MQPDVFRAGPPLGGQFALGGGRVAASGAQTVGQRPAAKKAPAKKKPAGPMSFDGKRGTGYGVKGGDPQVRTLQQALNRLGILDDGNRKFAVDGKYGPRTTAAVKKLQQRLGLKADGQVTPEFLKQISGLKSLPAAKKTAAPAKKAPAKKAPPPKQGRRVIRRGELVEMVRGALMRRDSLDPVDAMLYDRAYPLDDIQISRSGDGRTVEAYAAIFGTPYEVRDQHGHYMEVIDRAAFDRTLRGLAGQHAMCLYNHGMTLHGTPSELGSVPLGTPLEIRPDGRGLLTVTRYNQTPLADSVLEAIRNGDIRSQSFRGRIIHSSRNQRSGQKLPTITRHELGLTDYGPTPIPVNAGAAILAVRSVDQVLNELAALDDDGRLEVLRCLGVDLDADDTEDESATPDDSGPGAEDPPLQRHSGRQAMDWIALRSALRTKGVLT